MAEIPDHLFEKMVDTQKDTAVALNRLVDIHEREAEDRRRDTTRAVNEVKTHIDARTERSERWWRNVVIGLGLMMLLANLLGVAAEKVLAIVK